MTENSASFILDCRGDPATKPVLTGVEAAGRLEGMLFELTLRQTYRNASDRVLEVVYTFPLPYQSVLLGFASELNGERQVGTIVAKRDAERQYEKSLADGDAPVMLEALPGGLHTANIGNLKPGDEIVLEVRFAQLLRFEQGRLRLSIPTTIAPRYGNAESAGLQPHQIPTASLTAEYPLALSVTVCGAWADGTIECPTHRCTCEVVEGGLRVQLAPGTWLDRDVVIIATPLKPLTTVVTASSDAISPDAPVVVMASFQPPHTEPRQRIALKLLVDCSGSMAGDSIASARIAVQSALDGLADQDHVSVSRFGSTVDHIVGPIPFSPKAQREARTRIGTIHADLGGTEMEAALLSVFEIPMPSGDSVADVLMFTDGEIWDTQSMVQSARASRHRIFVIGVGSSAAEGVLRSLAEATGGACEFATPGEALEAAAARMLVRIRQQQPWGHARIEWRGDALWQTPLPLSVFGGDTVISFAGMQEQGMPPSAHLWVKNPSGEEFEVASGHAFEFSRGDTLSRMAAARRVAATSESESLKLSLAYQLMSTQTHCILVHERDDADKATEDAQLHRVDSMLAAGWGATGSAMRSDVSFSILTPPTTSMTSIANTFDDMDDDTGDADAFDAEANKTQEATLGDIMVCVLEHLRRSGGVRGLDSRCDALILNAETVYALDTLTSLGIRRGEAWLVLAFWVSQRATGELDIAASNMLKQHLLGVDAQLIEKSMAWLERLLGGFGNSDWTPSREKRLQRALMRQ